MIPSFSFLILASGGCCFRLSISLLPPWTFVPPPPIVCCVVVVVDDGAADENLCFMLLVLNDDDDDAGSGRGGGGEWLCFVPLLRVFVVLLSLSGNAYWWLSLLFERQ